MFSRFYRSREDLGLEAGKEGAKKRGKWIHSWFRGHCVKSPFFFHSWAKEK
jgi:hypothetical protein